MKKLVKVIALVLCFAMIAAFAACGGNKTDDQTTTAPANPGTAEAAFKIGLIGPLTGGAAIYGNAANTARRSLSMRSTPRAAFSLSTKLKTTSTIPRRALTLTTPCATGVCRSL